MILVNLASGLRLNTFSRHLPLAVQPLHHRLLPFSAPRVPCKPASPELAAASRPSFRSSRLFLGKLLAVCITLYILCGIVDRCWLFYSNTVLIYIRVSRKSRALCTWYMEWISRDKYISILYFYIPMFLYSESLLYITYIT